MHYGRWNFRPPWVASRSRDRLEQLWWGRCLPGATQPKHPIPQPESRMKIMNKRVIAVGLLALAMSVPGTLGADWSSQPNIFGGYSYTSSQGDWVQSSPNVFGGYNYSSQDGNVGHSAPNIFGGKNYTDSRGQQWQSSPNIFGGYDYTGPKGKRIQSSPNVFGGRHYSGPGGTSGRSTPNIFGGHDYSGPLFRPDAERP